MNVGALLVAVRDRKGWTQAQLAAAGGTSRAAVTEYESGKRSPSVATLDRLLAGAGLQIRAELEPLRAELDARVEAVSGEVRPLADAVVEALRRAADALGGEHPYVRDRGWTEEPERGVGELQWGFDGETALRLQGLGFELEAVQIAVRWDDVARTYFFQRRVRGTGGPPVSWFEADRKDAQECLGSLAIGPFGMVPVRLLDQPSDTLRVEVAPGLVVPVLTVAEVERGRPDLAEVVARLRDRRAS